MSTGAVTAVVVGALVVLAVVVAYVMAVRGGGGSPGLKRRFGPEYERTLARHDGDSKATRRELAERVKRYGGIEFEPLSEEARERYGASWTGVQARFVDEPGPAVTEADRLVAGLAAERGFPGAESPEHYDALSVHHPHHVQGYRHAHALAEHGPSGGRATEELRQALLGARALFEELLHDAARTPARKTPAEVTSGEETPQPDLAEAGPDRRGSLTTRFGALTGGARKGQPSGSQPGERL